MKVKHSKGGYSQCAQEKKKKTWQPLGQQAQQTRLECRDQLLGPTMLHKGDCWMQCMSKKPLWPDFHHCTPRVWLSGMGRGGGGGGGGGGGMSAVMLISLLKAWRKSSSSRAEWTQPSQLQIGKHNHSYKCISMFGFGLTFYRLPSIFGTVYPDDYSH